MDEAHSTLEIADSILKERSDDRDARLFKSLGLALLGRIHSEQGEPVRARNVWNEALSTIEPVARGSMDARFLGPWARILGHLGQTADATDILGSLKAKGYKTFDYP